MWSKRPGACSFIAGTLVLTDKGFKKIEEIKPGDIVLAYNDTTHEYGNRKVIKVFEYVRDTIYQVRIGTDTINTTSDHPFFVGGRWLKVGTLRVGDSVTTYSGTKIAITAITPIAKRMKVHNFEVAGFHTYYVSAEKVLVHNSGPCPVKGGVGPNITGDGWEVTNKAGSKVGRETFAGPVTGKARIADKSTTKFLKEFKANESYVQHFSSQIKDGYQHALNTGRKYVLKLKRPGSITKPLKEAAAKSNGRFIIR